MKYFQATRRGHGFDFAELRKIGGRALGATCGASCDFSRISRIARTSDAGLISL